MSERDLKPERPGRVGAAEASAGDSIRQSLLGRRNFLARLLPELEQRRLRTGEGEVDLTEQTVHSLRLRLADIDAQLAQLEGGAVER